MAYFEINNLLVKHKSFEGVRTVLNIDHFEIEKGETVGLVGESGQGKTVFALSILKLLQCPPGIIERGEVLIDGEDIMRMKPSHIQKNIRGSKVTMIFQDPMSSLNPVFTVGSTMLDVIRKNNKGISKKAAHDKAIKLLEEVKLADASSIMSKYPHQMSGGQRQRVIIALALSCGARFLIADEPTRNLDVTIQASILKLLRELQEKHDMTVLFIANNLSLVSAFCDKVAVLHEGKIIEQGTTRQIITSPSEEYTARLLGAVSRHQVSKESTDNDEAMLRIENLKKYFLINDELRHRKNQILKAVDGVSFELKKGEVLGIVGESGCGKSTLVNTILGLYPPTEGKAYIEGKDVFESISKKDSAYKKNVQIVFQDPYWSLNPRWLIKDIVSEPIEVHEDLSEKQRLDRVTELLELVGIPAEAAYQYPHEFSGGQRQRIAIARALASGPKLIVLDEPTSSIDLFSQAQILSLLKDLRKSLGLTNILISHDMGVVYDLSSKIAVMYLGKIVELGSAEDVFRNPRHPYTRALFDSIPDIENIGMKNLKTLEGQIPSPVNPPSGCAFHTRCAYAMEKCSREEPPEVRLDDGRIVRCMLQEFTDGNALLTE